MNTLGVILPFRVSGVVLEAHALPVVKFALRVILNAFPVGSIHLTGCLHKTPCEVKRWPQGRPTQGCPAPLAAGKWSSKSGQVPTSRKQSGLQFHEGAISLRLGLKGNLFTHMHRNLELEVILDLYS